MEPILFWLFCSVRIEYGKRITMTSTRWMLLGCLEYVTRRAIL